VLSRVCRAQATGRSAGYESVSAALQTLIGSLGATRAGLSWGHRETSSGGRIR
jgi:hypothetical protein